MSNNTQFMSVVDDEPDIMCLFRDALSQMKDFSLFGFTDPMLALEHFIHNRSNYSLILSDYRIPGLNGIQLLRYVKKINPSVKTMLISAFDTEDKLFEECNCVDKILQKPISIPELVNEVEWLMPTKYDFLTH
jgi:DNA-binding NtrC family response regulator